MNYTKSNDLSYQDKPEDWLNSALIMTRALGLILKDKEGVIVDIVGDINPEIANGAKKLMVFSEGDQIKVEPFSDNIEEGTLIWVH